MTKSKLKIILPSVVLILIIVLDIILLCTPVFKGTYTDLDGVYSFAFSENTYIAYDKDETIGNGMYTYKNGVVDMGGVDGCIRKSVFVLSYGGTTDFRCTAAIILQCFYSAVILACVMYLVIPFVLRIRKRQVTE